MAQAGFQHSGDDAGGHAAALDAPFDLSVSVFADRAHVRDTIRDDALAAGFRLQEAASVEILVEGSARPIGDVVLLDCPVMDGRACAALSRLDMRAANAGSQLVVSTSLEALEDVFACLDQSQPQILVNPTRGERVIALGRVLGTMPRMRARELSGDDRLTLLRLTEQVGQIAERLEALSEKDAAGSAFRLGSPSPTYRGPQDASKALVKPPRPPLPDPRLVRRIIRQRQLRSEFFDRDLFADPAWDMLLDLTAARAEHTRVSVTSLCIASGVPPTTALRWIGQMTEAGLMERVEDETDRRRAFIALSDKAADGMARYFEKVGADALAFA